MNRFGRAAAGRALLCTALLTPLLALAGCSGPDADPAAARASTPEVEPGEPESWGYRSLQLHLHGSLSEGAGSMAGQTAAAVELGGVDVLWWTDHDWRIARHTFVDGFDFDRREKTLTIPHRGTPWSKRPRRIRYGWRERRGGAALARAGQRLVPRRLDDGRIEGERALELTAEALPGGGGWGWTGGELYASGGRFLRPLLAGMVVDLDLRPENPLGDDAQLEIRFELSHQPEGPAEIVYRAGDHGPRRVQRAAGKLLGVVPVELAAGRWTRLSLPLSDDAAALGLGGEDNSVRRIELRLKTRRGAAARLLVDRLRLRARRDGDEVLAVQASWLEEHAARGDGPRHHVGLEVSYGVHMNLFLPEPELPDFVHHVHGMDPRQAVSWAHERGGVVSYNHLFGAGDDPDEETRAAQAARGDLAVREALFGADLLEVGYPQRVLPLADHLAVWDRLSARGVVVTGIGTSDSHHQGEGWRDGNNYLSWVWAAGLERTQLIAALACGRVYFGDPARFRGPLELRAAGGGVMGQVLERGAGRRRLLLEGEGLPAGVELRWIVDGRVARSERPAAGALRSEIEAEVGDPGFVRAELWLDGRGLAFTNPVYFTSDAERGAPCRHEL